MQKLKKKLRVVVSIVLVIAALGSTAAIFGLSRAPGEEDPGIIISPVGYMDGTTRGTGKYFSDAKTITFAESDKSIIELYDYRNYAFQFSTSGGKKVVGWNSHWGEATETVDGYRIVKDEDDADTYLDITTNSGALATESKYSHLSFQINSSSAAYAQRQGLYTLEFDVMIPEEIDVSVSGDTDESFMQVVLAGINSFTASNFYFSTRFQPTDVEGYYTISNWQKIDDVRNNTKVLLKYGEWYNVRLECYLDKTSEYYKMNLIVNDTKVVTYNAPYNMCNVSGYVSGSQTYAPQCFIFAPRMRADYATYYIDNVYTNFDRTATGLN